LREVGSSPIDFPNPVFPLIALFALQLCSHNRRQLTSQLPIIYLASERLSSLQ
jgi:hypothetical protein